MRTLAGVLVAALVGCHGDAPEQIGTDQLFKVRNAQFIRDPLPGEPPSEDESTAHLADAGANTPPSILSVETANLSLTQGQGGKKFSGRATPNAYSFALSLAEVSAGYWVLPIGTPDPVTNETTWQATADFDPSIKPGFHELRVVAIDEHGVAGRQSALRLCVKGKVSDNANACFPTKNPPQAIVSLSWDANVDLDLQVIGPDGRVIDSKHPASAAPDKDGKLPADIGSIDRDSNGSCVIDGIRTENLVWDTVMPQGRYGIYVNLFDSCKQPAVRFLVEIYTASAGKKSADMPDAAPTETLTRWYSQGGELLDFQANGGSARGLFVTEFVFN